MSELIATESQQLYHDTIITLYEIDASKYGGGILRFQSSSHNTLTFNGYDYTPFPIKASGFEYNGRGQAPEPNLTVSVVDLAFTAQLLSANNLVNCDVRRIKTFRKYLDDGSDPQPNATLVIDEFYISRMSEKTSTHVTFVLASKLDVRGKQIPARQIIKSTCMHSYRVWDAERNRFNYENATCPYAQASYYDRKNFPTSDPAEDVCSRDLAGCKARYGQYALPFAGFPGARRY